MNAVKDSMLIRQHDPEVQDITILYTDLRAFGKGFDAFVKRSFEEQSAHYTRGRPAKIEEDAESRNLEVFVENTLDHEQQRLAVLRPQPLLELADLVDESVAQLLALLLLEPEVLAGRPVGEPGRAADRHAEVGDVEVGHRWSSWRGGSGARRC